MIKKLSEFILLALLSVIIVGAFLFGIRDAKAAGINANVSWTSPTTYTDGTPLPASDVGFYTVKWATSGGAVQTRNVTTLSTLVIVPCGSASFSLSVTTSPTARHPNAESADTPAVTYNSGVVCRPNPPTAVTVE